MSNSGFRIVTAWLWALVFAGAPGSVFGNELLAPASVVAAIDGSFSYQAKFYKGPGTDELGSFGWFGEENVSGGAIADCFCTAGMCTMEAGDSLTIEVAGQLTYLDQPGRVLASVSLCASPGPTTYTTILPYGTTAVERPAPPAGLHLWNVPNPVSRSTTFHWDLQEPGPVQLRIYDLAGRLLATVVDEVRPAGHQQALWDVRTAPAIRSAGVCFARLSVPGRSSTRTIVVMRR